MPASFNPPRISSYTQTWNLDSLFTGGSTSSELHAEIQTLSEGLEKLKKDLEHPADLRACVHLLQQIEMRSLELESFICCLLAQDVSDQLAIQLNDRLASLKATQEDLSNQLNAYLIALSDEEFDQLLIDKNIQPIAFTLKERRSWAKEKLPLDQEKLINQLSIDGYQGWNELYTTLIGLIRIPFNDQELSVGQAESKLTHADRTMRETFFRIWTRAWQSQEKAFAQILNHLAGFRLKVYKARGWTSLLKEALFYNRMQEETLHTMWQTIEQNKKPLEAYLSKKAQLLGLKQLSWFDIEAPLPQTNHQSIPFQEAAVMIVECFNQFSPAMGQFAKQAFQNRWIEAEDRTGKLPGGFCSQHPQSKESRIFMTYSGTITNIFTLAHELGHAYHNNVVKDLPMLSQQYRMNVAETASTLAEMALVDSLIKKADHSQEKMALLDSKLQRSVLFLMNIHARFLFETRLYAAREKAFILASDLNQLMEEAQKEAFHHTLAEWYPQFWTSKGHFYFTEVPFYNFPYTFGYLFSLGIYAQGLKEGKQFAQRYEDLLRDTGRMDVEVLAQKHLGVNLRQPDFWQEGLNLIKQDVEDYLIDFLRN